MNKYDEYILSDNQFQQSSISWLSTLRSMTIPVFDFMNNISVTLIYTSSIPFHV